MDAVPLSLALVAGGLATLNPCGFPLLPAFLSFYVGAEQERLPRAPNRVAQAMLVGLLVTAGFLGLFTVVGLPVALGARLVARAVPWAGIAIGVILVTLGLFTLAGRHAVYAVWEPALPTDSRSEWDASVLADPRVVQFWDQKRVTTRWLAGFRADFRSLLHADAYLLFGPDARWGTNPEPVIVGGPNIIGRSSELKDEITPLLSSGALRRAGRRVRCARQRGGRGSAARPRADTIRSRPRS